MEATVTTTEGTVETPEVVVAETKPPTLAETEAKYREDFDKSRGRDVSKLVSTAPTKKEEVKAEVKAETTTEVKKDEPKPDTPKVEEKKPTSGIGRLKAKLAATQQETKELRERLAALESGRTTTTPKPESKPVVLVEPKQEDFATVAEWIGAIRKYDKEVAAQEKQQQEAAKIDEGVRAIYEGFNKRLEEVKKAHPDWSEKAAKVTVEFNPILEGVLITADPEILYHFASNQREAKNLNDLVETSVIAVGNADDVGEVLKYLAANPDDIDKLNALNPVKAQNFVGKLESKIEAGKSSGKTQDKPADNKQSSSGTDASQKTGKDATEAVKPKTEEPKPVAKVEVKQDRERPEPPAKVQGGTVPSTNDWKEPAHMSFAERERLFKEDPRYAKRR